VERRQARRVHLPVAELRRRRRRLRRDRGRDAADLRPGRRRSRPCTDALGDRDRQGRHGDSRHACDRRRLGGRRCFWLRR
jgi:hypothetical protein